MTVRNDGVCDLFAGHRAPAWQGVGNVFDHEVTDYMEMLELAGMAGWGIHEVPIAVDGVDRFVRPAKAIVANIGDEAVGLGIAGDRYEIVQNEDAFSFVQSLTDGSRWDSAGTLKGNTVAFGSIVLDREIVLDPTGVADVVKAYLLVTTSHDGSGSVRGGRTAVRVECQNTLNIALKGIEQAFSFRHTMTVAERMEKGAAEWRKNNLYFDAFEIQAQKMIEQTVSNEQFFGIVADLFPKPEKDVKGALKKWENRQELYTQAWNGRPNAGIKNTAWGAFNALTEANQWGRQVRNTDNGNENFYAAGAGLDNPTNAFRQEALERVLALA